MPVSGLNFTDEEISGATAGKSPDEIAQLAQRYGLNADQIQQATQIGGQNWTANDINGYAQSHGMDFNGQGGALTQAANAGQSGGMDIPGYGHVSKAELDSFFASGGNPNEWAQTHGITNADAIHSLSTQARTLAGVNNPTGDAAMQNAWQDYKLYNPNGAHANDYNGFVASQDPLTANAIRAGTYTGAHTSSKDWEPGGIYAPGTGHDFTYQQSGLGARGYGDGWTKGAAPLSTSLQTSQPMKVNEKGALVYVATGTSTPPAPGTPGWVQPPQGGSLHTASTSSLVGSNGQTPDGALTQVASQGTTPGANPYQHIFRPDQQSAWMNYHADGLPSSDPLTFHAQDRSTQYASDPKAGTPPSSPIWGTETRPHYEPGPEGQLPPTQANPPTTVYRDPRPKWLVDKTATPPVVGFGTETHPNYIPGPNGEMP